LICSGLNDPEIDIERRPSGVGHNAEQICSAGALTVGRNRLWWKGCAQSQREPGCAGADAVQVRIDCPLEEILGVRSEVSHPDAEIYPLNIVFAGLPELHVTETVASNEASRYIARTWSQKDFEIVVRFVTR
jgi:hypothetical protein